MIPEKSNVTVSSNISSLTPIQMTVNLDSMSHIMSVLSNLYSNRVLAVFRETVTNAIDSHVAVNTDKKVRVHLPTELSPYFEVQDWGLGLSKDEVYMLFGSYGASSKRHSNSFNGTLGLGSKAAFTLTDSFALTSVHNFNKTFYSIHLNENGVGAISVVQEMTTDEQNGVTVTVPMVRSQYSDYDVYKAFYFLRNKIEINHELNQWLELVKTENYCVYENKLYQSSSNLPHVLMGGVLYPIENITDYNTKFFNSSRQTALVLLAGMGEVEFTPSREALKYTEKTKRFLVNALNKVEADISKDIITEFSCVTGMVNYNILSPTKHVTQVITVPNHDSVKLYYVSTKDNKLTQQWFSQKLPAIFVKVDATDLHWEDYFKLIRRQVRYLAATKGFVCLVTDDLIKKYPNQTWDVHVNDVVVKRINKPNTVKREKTITVLCSRGFSTILLTDALKDQANIVCTNTKNNVFNQEIRDYLVKNNKTLVYRPSETVNTLVNFLLSKLPQGWENLLTFTQENYTVFRSYNLRSTKDINICKTLEAVGSKDVDFVELESLSQQHLPLDLIPPLKFLNDLRVSKDVEQAIVTRNGQLTRQTESLVDKLNKKYPLLEHTIYSQYSRKDIVEYIRQKDKK